MIELDAYYPFWLANSLVALDTTRGTPPLSTMIQALATARLGLESPSEAFRAAFPDTCTHITELLEYINKMLPSVPAQFQDRIVSEFEMKHLRSLLSSIAVTFRDEAKRRYVLSLEDQRCLSSYTLVEKIENCFPVNTWSEITLDAKREFEESGKCLAMERFTGTGFHALRGVECVIRQYIELVTGSLPRKRDWGHYIDVLKQNNADAGLVGVLDNIRTQERNPLMHPEDWLDVDDAVGIFNIAHTAVARLIADLKKKGKLS